MGVASGPVSFMQVFDSATEAIKQGGTRRGANMGILRVDHPDIDEFIAMKADMTTLQNFNISVAVTDRFMEARRDGRRTFDTHQPAERQVVGHASAASSGTRSFNNAWKNGDPGVDLHRPHQRRACEPGPEARADRIDEPVRRTAALSLRLLQPGFDQPRPLHEGRAGQQDGRLRAPRPVVRRTVHLLDNVIEMNNYPIPEIAETSHAIRRIGLGVMGWADLLDRASHPLRLAKRR